MRNSVNCVDGKKLHQNAADLQAHRNVNDEICLNHGLSVLEKAERHSKKKRMKPGEYQVGLTDYIGVKVSAEHRKICLQVPDTLLDALTLSTTNETISLSTLTVKGSINISSNGGNIVFDKLDIGDSLTLSVKNGDISGTVVGSYEDFTIQSEVKKGKSNLPDNKEGSEKVLHVSSNNGDVHIAFIKE